MEHSISTCDVDVHNASASSNAIGGVTDVSPRQVIGNWPLEKQGVVLDFHVAGKGAIQAARRRGKNSDTIKSQNYTKAQSRKKKHKKSVSQEHQSNSKHFKNTVSSAKQTYIHAHVGG